MSVINQMLKDLEKRSRSPIKSEVALSGIISPNEQNGIQRNIILTTVAILCCLLFAVLIVIGFQHQKTTQNHESETSTALSQNPSMIIKPTQTSSNADPVFVPSLLTGITLQTQADITFLHLLLNHDVLYRISADVTKQQLTVILENTRLLTSVPKIDYANSALTQISMTNLDDGSLKIVLSLADGGELQQINMKEAARFPELQIELNRATSYRSDAAATETAANTTPTLKKTLANTTVEQTYQSALTLAQSGQAQQAVEQLSNVLQQYPEYNPARLLLVELLQQQGLQRQASQVLQAGLMQQPDNLRFIQIRARMLIDQGKALQALALLEAHTPPIAQNPDYYAMIAVLYQQQGQASVAARIYQQLLATNSNNAVWWAGLGISLENQGKQTEALEAYAHADSSEQLSPELRAYIESRMH